MLIDFEIKSYPFSNAGKNAICSEEKGHDWPVVYLLTNNDNHWIYIGETNNVTNRISQHLQNPAKQGLNKIDIIFDKTFNKSAILDIEQNLIQYCCADKKFKILNKNGGQSSKHNYYQRESYMSKFDLIWEELRKIGLVEHSIEKIRNSDLFKYSPYNTLTEEQEEVSRSIIYDMMDKLVNKKDGTSIINGGAGTGKTIVIINMIYKLINALKMDFDDALDDPDLSDYIQFIHDIKQFIIQYKGKNKELKIAYVSPMTSLRATIKEVFNQTGNGLKGSFVFGPLDIVNDVYLTKEKFDIVFVDEAHRLAKRKNIGYISSYDKAAKKCGLDPMKSNLLDFIVRSSKYRVLVYDANQTIKGSDITEEEFYKSLSDTEINKQNLKTQLRCCGGKGIENKEGGEYITYLDKIFSCEQQGRYYIKNYDLKLFYDVDDMIKTIQQLNKKIHLCRNVAGYSWKWKSKGLKSIEEIKRIGKEDIEMKGSKYKYIWNMTNEKWILADENCETIGCVHTTQGYDLNYVGIIFGEEIDYDSSRNCIVINRTKFFDTNVKKGVNDDMLKNFILNAYKVMMSRGIKGCYVYVCKEGLRKYLSQFIDKAI